MVGEMRDDETANTAIAAALSGQLVFATLHSSDAPRSVERLVELGVTRGSISAALTAIVAQRLVRRLCPHCKVAKTIDPAAAAKYGLDSGRMYFEPVGCERCSNAGYHERIGIFEIIVLDDELCDEIGAGVSSVGLARAAARRGFVRLRDDCVEKVNAGITSVSEYARIAHSAGLP
jgi:type II secretory ATPase GspE/PulE/Tfp pilus assembly ATPase PilB-like protein